MSIDALLTNASDNELIAAWKDKLSPWLASISNRIGFSTARRRTAESRVYTSAMSVLLAERDDLRADFWVFFLPFAGARRSEWITWLEALELLGLVATLSKRVCWQLLFNQSYDARALKQFGWTQHFFYDMRPRFEFRFDPSCLPTDEIMTLLLNGIPSDDHSDDYTHVRCQLIELVAFRRYDHVVSIRFHFAFAAQTDQELAEAHRHSERRMKNGLAPSRSGRRQEQGAFSPLGSTFTVCTRPDDAREWLRAIAAKVPVFSLDYGVSSRATGIGNFYGPFLWRLLAPHTSLRPQLGVQRLSLDANGIMGRAPIVALCSALLQSRTLQEFSFTESRTTSETDSRLWASWLAFALFSPTATHRIRNVHLDVDNRLALYADAMQHVLDQDNAIGYLDALSRNTTGGETALTNWPSMAVRVRAHAKIGGNDLPPDSAAATVYHGKQPTECLVAGPLRAYGKVIRVLVPGVGFGYVHRSDVESIQPTPRARTHGVRSLSLSVNGLEVAPVVTILRLVGEPLISLSVRDADASDTSPRIDVGLLMAHCPNVTRLRLDNLSLPIHCVTAASWGRKVRTLAVSSCRVLPSTPVNPPNTSSDVFPDLSSLYVGTVKEDDPPECQAFLRQIVRRPQLERFVVECNSYVLQTQYAVLTKPYDGVPIPGLCPRQKLAFLSVVSQRRSQSTCTRYCGLNADTIIHIFELAARSTHTRISAAR